MLRQAHPTLIRIPNAKARTKGPIGAFTEKVGGRQLSPEM